MGKLTHFDKDGRARMVDVGAKTPTRRMAVVSGKVSMKPETLRRIIDKKMEKGDVLGIARVAGIMAAKRTGEIIPLCHPLSIDTVEIDLQTDVKRSEVRIETKVKSTGKPAWRWKPSWPRRPRPLPFTICAKPWTGG